MYYQSAPVSAAAWVDAGPGSAFSIETAAGYRLTPEVTFRIGYVGYRAWTSDALSHHAAVSIVWSHRWR